MLIYELRTKRGIRLHQTYKGANRAIEEDIQDLGATILTDTRDGKTGTVVAEYESYYNHSAKEVYEIKMVPVYS